MTPATTRDPLVDRLLAQAEGSRSMEAAVMVLVYGCRGRLLPRMVSAVVEVPERGFAFFDWDEVSTVLNSGLSGGERRLVEVAGSLGAGWPVVLSDVTTNLDEANARLVVEAVNHAAGWPVRVEW